MPNYFRNNLEPVPVDPESLREIRKELAEAIHRGLKLIQANCPPPNPTNGVAYGNIYTGSLGIALMGLRVSKQAKYIENSKEAYESLASEAQAITKSRVQPERLRPTGRPVRIAALTSPQVSAAIMRSFATATKYPIPPSGEHPPIYDSDIAAISDAVDRACEKDYPRGEDEVLYGRAGLLNAITYIRRIRLDEESKIRLQPVFDAVPQIVDSMIENGKIGAREFVNKYGEQEALPLMWPWHNKYYIGAIHGICGILTNLLACKVENLGRDQPRDHIPIIGQTITELCRICVSCDGHLPSILPYPPSGQQNPLVQICHGVPGLLYLLSVARGHPYLASRHWEPIWDQAIYLGSQRVWEQGLVVKGGGLCHGIAGNAWTLLLMHDTLLYGPLSSKSDRTLFHDRYCKSLRLQQAPHELDPDQFLSRALTFLLHARKTQPFNTQTYQDSIQYRMPDNPYSLYEGLAGNVTAWSDACVVITARLRKIELDETVGCGAFETDGSFQRDLRHKYGIPGLSFHN